MFALKSAAVSDIDSRKLFFKLRVRDIEELLKVSNYLQWKLNKLLHTLGYSDSCLQKMTLFYLDQHASSAPFFAYNGRQ